MKTVTIVGRPNVGKSAFFNRLTGTRRALVHDLPGVTRDRLYGEVEWVDRRFRLCDTGGLEPGSPDLIKNHIETQVAAAVAESSVIVFMVDGKVGLHALDSFIADYLRRHSPAPVILVVNKVDSQAHSGICADFYGLGFDEVLWTSSLHGTNVGSILDRVVELLQHGDEGPHPAATVVVATDDSRLSREEIPAQDEEETLDDSEEEWCEELGDLVDEDEGPKPLRLVIVGRPNVGKSSLINHLIKEKRLIVDDQPGTTHGPVDIPFSLEGREVVLVDTAGIKRRSRGDTEIQRLCSATARGAIRTADICILVLDPTEGIIAQDKHIAGDIVDEKRACIFAVNKWDLIEEKGTARPAFEKTLAEEFKFVPYATTVFFSALTGRGISSLLERIMQVADNCRTVIPTGRLNEIIREAQLTHEAPARKGGRRLKIYYAVQLRQRAGTFAFVVNDPKLAHFSFTRYLENALRRAADFSGVPLRFLYRERTGRHHRPSGGPTRPHAKGHARGTR